MVIKLNYKIIITCFLISILLVTSLILFKPNTNEANASLEQSDTIYVPIIMYHEIKTFKTGKDVITPYEFESDLKYLTENNYTTITMTQLIDYVYNDESLPSNPIILSFDDGYLNTYKNALPLLKKYNMKIVLSLIGKDTDDFTRVPNDNIDYSHVTWDQLKEMIDTGLVEVQNHSYNLHKLGTGCTQASGESFEDYEKTLTDDIGNFQKELVEKAGVEPNTFTYPFGGYSDNTDIVLKKLGFKATLSCTYGISKITKDPDSLYGLKRICRSHDYSIKKALDEGMKTIKKQR